MSNIHIYNGIGCRVQPRIAVVAARFNETIVKNLLEGALDTLQRQGISEIDIYWVPGAFEIPVVCERILHAKKVQGIVALGAVIRGDTPHFDYVAGNCASQVASIAVRHSVPIAFAVLTTDTIEQAQNRAGLKLGNKGAEAAVVLLETLSTLQQAEI